MLPLLLLLWIGLAVACNHFGDFCDLAEEGAGEVWPTEKEQRGAREKRGVVTAWEKREMADKVGGGSISHRLNSRCPKPWTGCLTTAATTAGSVQASASTP